MSQYLFVYHGGGKPGSPEEAEQVIQAWRSWFESMGDALIDAGNPVGLSTTINSDGTVSNNGGSNPVSGYSVIEADSLEDAIKYGQSCPMLQAENGHIEIAEALHVM